MNVLKFVLTCVKLMFGCWEEIAEKFYFSQFKQECCTLWEGVDLKD